MLFRSYKQCASNASRLFKNEKIQGKIKDIFLSRLNDSEIDARLSEIALHSEASSSIQAIKEYNNLKQRITKKIDITSAGRPLQALSDDELKALAE